MFFDLLNTLYEFFYRQNFTKSNKTSIIRVLSNALAILLRFIIRHNLWMMRLSSKRLSYSNVVISITSFPQRFCKLHYSIISILRQKTKPEKIVVNLTQQECPNGIDDLPSKLKNLQHYGVEFVFRPQNLKPHNKYFYVLQEYTNKIVITMDDDVIYRRDAIDTLLKLHHSHPNSVCARHTRKINLKNGKIQSYNSWPLYTKNNTNQQQLALGVGGVLYPPKIFSDNTLFNEEYIKKYSFKADDLWLKAVELLQGIQVVSGEFEAPDITLDTSYICGLSSENVENNANDVQWNALDKVFGINEIINRTNTTPIKPKPISKNS